MKITIKSSSLVKPSLSTCCPAPTIIWNSNIDLVIPRIHTPSVYFYTNRDCSPDFFSCNALKDSLARALVPFYPMAGRLKLVEEVLASSPEEASEEGEVEGKLMKKRRTKRRVDIQCNGEGVLFVEASADGTIREEYGELFTPSMAMRRLIPTIHGYDDIQAYPLLIIQVTSFRCGGVSLGVGVQHHVADGIAALSFLNYWGQVCKASVRRSPAPPPPPPVFLDRRLLKARDPPNPTFDHVEYQPPPPLLANRHPHPSTMRGSSAMPAANGSEEDASRESYWKEREEIPPATPPLMKTPTGDGNGDVSDGGFEEIASDLFVFTKEQLEYLKRKASLSMDQSRKLMEHTGDDSAITDNGGGSGGNKSNGQTHGSEDMGVALTSYEVLSAHVWRCVSIARGLQDAQVSKLYIATDGRNRLRPPLPHGYFGNSIFTATPMRTVHSLVKRPLAETAHAIRSTLHNMNDEYLRSAIDYLELQPDITSLARGAHTFRSPNLGITSWARLPIYETEFGWGRPVSMGPAGVPFEGLAYILPPPPPPPPPASPSSSMLLSITLSPNHMQRFRQLIHNFEELH